MNMAKRQDIVSIRCYDRWEKMDRKEAIDKYSLAILCSDGFELKRYALILAQLVRGENVCTDEDDEEE